MSHDVCFIKAPLACADSACVQQEDSPNTIYVESLLLHVHRSAQAPPNGDRCALLGQQLVGDIRVDTDVRMTNLLL